MLIGCDTYNSKMNNLLESKAKLESEYKFADSISGDYTRKNTKMINTINKKYLEKEISGKGNNGEWFKEIMMKQESSEYKSNTENALKYENNLKILLNQIKSVEYSIDSLSKLK
jgi:hypothetical protein